MYILKFIYSFVYIYNNIDITIIPTQRNLKCILFIFREGAFSKCLGKTLISKYKKLYVLLYLCIMLLFTYMI